MKKTSLLSACLAVSTLVSCGGDVVGPSGLRGEWRLASLRRADFSTATVPSTLSLTAYFGEDDRLGLRADCNVCGGAFALDGDAIVAGPFACTRAFCASAPLDSEFVGLLEGRSAVRVDGDRLVLSSDRGALIFVR
ncbi:MAG: META domain-containing protein [Vicinamibacteria bacterium]